MREPQHCKSAYWNDFVAGGLAVQLQLTRIFPPVSVESLSMGLKAWMAEGRLGSQRLCAEHPVSRCGGRAPAPSGWSLPLLWNWKLHKWVQSQSSTSSVHSSHTAQAASGRHGTAWWRAYGCSCSSLAVVRWPGCDLGLLMGRGRVQSVQQPVLVVVNGCQDEGSFSSLLFFFFLSYFNSTVSHECIYMHFIFFCGFAHDYYFKSSYLKV